MQQQRKYFVIAAFSLSLLVVSVVRAPEHFVATPNMDIDSSFAITIGEGLHETLISGRDFHFGYGPLTQLFAFVGMWFHNPWSPLDALPLIILAFYTTSICMLGLGLVLLRELDWKQCAFIYIFVVALNLFSEPTSFRVLALLLTAVLTYRVLDSPSRSAMWWSILAGAMCLAAQLTTVEMGLYSVVAMLSTFAIRVIQDFWNPTDNCVKSRIRLLLTSAWIAAVTYISVNLTLCLLFALSSPRYRFFDYPRYALDTIRGYNVSFGAPWVLATAPTLGLAITVVFTLVAGWSLVRKPTGNCALLLLPFLVSSIISIKSALVRSDTGHITQAWSLPVFTFLLVGAMYLRDLRTFKTLAILWAGVFTLLFFSWPWAGVYFVSDLFAAGKSSPFIKVMRMSTAFGGSQNGIPSKLAAAVANKPNGPMLTFPYQNHIAIQLERKLVAPVFQALDASTAGLQRFYIGQLEEHGENLDVVYGVDDIAFPTLDSVQTITRLPIIFDYLYEHFALTTNLQFGQGFYLLRRTPFKHQLNMAEVFFDTHKVGGRNMEIRPRNPLSCSLLKFDLRVNYPAVQYLGKPQLIDLAVFQNETPLLKTGLVALEPKRRFSTYVSLIPPELFYKVFAKDSPPTFFWNRLQVGPRRSDWLGVAPSEIHIDKITCITIPTI